ncbi:MAG: YciI family protein [Acidocella sp.]|nr:YciI family protein [Acidocella sp.]
MPLFALHATDRPGALALRLEHSGAHRAYIETEGGRDIKVILSGPLQSDDGTSAIGSLFIFEAPDRATVETFAKADPFARYNVWESINIARFHRREGA